MRIKHHAASKKLFASLLSCVMVLNMLALGVQAEESSAQGTGQPNVFYTGNTWQSPGDIVLLRGNNLNLVEKVQLSRLNDTGHNAAPRYVLNQAYNTTYSEDELKKASEPQWNALSSKKVDILQISGESIKFMIPCEMKDGVYAVKLSYKESSQEKEKIVYINTPQQQWVQGDEGKIATPGGWLRIQGSNLAYDSSSKVKVVLENTETQKRISLSDCEIINSYSVQAKLTEKLSHGTYNVYLYNGFGSKTSWSNPCRITVGDSPKKSWPTEVFNVKDFGAIGDSKTIDNAAVLEALQAAKKNGGGIVYFPQGRYRLTIGGINIPENTILQGESSETTQVYWSPFDWELGKLPDYMLSGLQNFAIENITFCGSRIGTFLTSGVQSFAYQYAKLLGKKVGETYDYKNVYINNCKFYFNATAENSIVKYLDKYSGILEEINHEFIQKIYGFKLSGSNIQMKNNDMYFSCYPLESDLNYSILRNNVFDASDYSHLVALGGEKFIFEDNSIQGSIAMVRSENAYVADCTIENNWGGDREGFTTDGGGSYNSSSAQQSEDGLTLTLPEADMKDNEFSEWGIFVISGKGAGQYRTIVSNTKNTVKIESPFIDGLDETSFLSISKIRNNMFFINNKLSDVGSFQYYGTMTNAIMDGTEMARAESINAWARFVYGTYMPNWYCSFINNKLSQGNVFSYFGYDNATNKNYIYSSLKITGAADKASINIGTLIRNNDLKDGWHIWIAPQAGTDSIQDMVIQGNHIAGSKSGIVLNAAGGIRNSIICETTFKDVEKEWDISQDIINEKDSDGNNRILFFNTKNTGVFPLASGWIISVSALLTVAVMLLAVSIYLRVCKQKTLRESIKSALLKK